MLLGHRRNVIQGVQYKYSGPTVNKENSVVWRLYSMLTWVRDSCASCDPVRSLITNVIAAGLPPAPCMALGSSGRISPFRGTVRVLDTSLPLATCTMCPGSSPSADAQIFQSALMEITTGRLPVSTKHKHKPLYGPVAYNEEAAEIIHDNWKATEFVGNLQEAPVSNGGAASSCTPLTNYVAPCRIIAFSLTVALVTIPVMGHLDFHAYRELWH